MTSADESDAFLLRSAAGAHAGPCPDPGLVAGFAEGRLLDAEAEAVAAHAAGCATCRSAIAELAGESVAGGAPADEPRKLAPVLRFRLPLLAAAVLLVLGGGALLLARARRDAPLDTDARLVAAVRDLRSAQPTLFADFAPLLHAERIAVSDGRERGGLRLLSPAGVVSSSRPAFTWVAVPGAATYEVSVTRQDASALWTRAAAGAALPYPADVPALESGGRYAWSVSTEAVLGGRTQGRRTFAVASADETAALRRVTTAAETLPLDLRDLVVAHWAFRRDLLEDAERHARAHVQRDATGAAGRETLAAIRRRLGAPEGDTTEAPR